MGRRPGIKNGATGGLAMNGFSPEVKEELNGLALIFIKEVRSRLGDKIENGAFKNLELKDLMKVFNSTLKALQGPATSLQQINVPQAPQIAANGSPRPAEITEAQADPAKRKELRDRQAKYLEGQDA